MSRARGLASGLRDEIETVLNLLTEFGGELPRSPLPMPISPYVSGLRAVIGSQLLLVPAVAAIIRDDSDDVLLHRRSDDGRWSLPGGAIDPGESPATAVAREVREETGLDVIPVSVLGIFGGAEFRHVYPNGDEVEYTVVAFECRAVGGRLRAVDGEAVELRYFDPEGMPELTLPYPTALFQIQSPVSPLF